MYSAKHVLFEYVELDVFVRTGERTDTYSELPWVLAPCVPRLSVVENMPPFPGAPGFGSVEVARHVPALKHAPPPRFAAPLWGITRFGV